MLSFLNPALLVASLAALVPLIIHLFSRRRVKVIEFSSVRHLQSMQKRQVRRIQIRQWLLLATRMLLVLAIVLAFARPTLQSGSIGSHASVSAVIIVDNSASMNRFVSDGNLFEIARQRTDELLATFSQADRVCLMPMVVSAGEQFQFSSAATAREELGRLRPQLAGAGLTEPLERAAALFEETEDLNRELYLVTDRQAASLPDTLLWQQYQIPILVVDLPTGERENLGVVKVDLGGQLITPHQEFVVTGTIRNFGDQPASERLASLFLDNRRVAQTEVSVGPGSETTVRFAASVPSAGLHDGFIELSDDPLPADNRRYFSFRIPDRFSVLIVQNDGGAPFLSLALNPGEALNQYWTTKQVTPEEAASVPFGEFDVIVLAGLAGLPPPVAARARAAVESGRSLLAIQGAATEVSELNAIWSDLCGFETRSAMPQVVTRSGYYTIASIDMKHPVFSLFRFEDGKLPLIKFYALPSIVVADDAELLMTLSGEHPGLLERTVGRGRVMSMPLSIAPEYSDLITQGFFVPFASRLVEYLASDLSALDQDQIAGEPVTRPIPQSTPGSFVTLFRPDSVRVDLAPEESGGGQSVSAQPSELAGIYALRAGDREFDRFALNLPSTEGVLEQFDGGELAAATGATAVRLLSSGNDMQTQIAGLRVGTELWPLLLWIALALCAVEMLLAKGRDESDS